MGKTRIGNFFEDFTLGQSIRHAVPRTVTEGDRAVYSSIYPSRFSLYSSSEFARSCGLAGSPLEDLAAFHVVFGKTVPDISLNAIANLGYGEARFLCQVYPGDTLSAVSEVIGLKQNSNGRSGVVWVRSTGVNQNGTKVLEFCRWVMVRKRDPEAPAPQTVIPDLAASLGAEDLIVPAGLDFSGYDFELGGESWRARDYKTGETIDHLDRVTVEEAEHMAITRLWQNTARVHFDATLSEDGRRLVYGGHVISMARALSFNGLANAQIVAGINAGSHANPCFAGDTIRAWSEILDRSETSEPGVAALRIRTVAARADQEGNQPGYALKDDGGRYLPHVLLDLDYWALLPA